MFHRRFIGFCWSFKEKFGNAPDSVETDLVLIFPMCSTDFTCVSCVNGSTIQSVLRELLLIDGKLMGFRIKLFKKQFVCLLFSVYSFITLVKNVIVRHSI